MKQTITILLILFSVTCLRSQDNDPIIGAWQSSTEDGQLMMLIITQEHFSMTYFRLDPAEFIATRGGKWERLPSDSLHLTVEFDTENKESVGMSANQMVTISGDQMKGESYTWSRLDDGGPGALAGAWLITGRKRDGELSQMTPGARKTMKILSGTRFQWIAYNSETGEFFGTGAGTYTTENGKYTEHIQVFSRDNNRVGASLEFDYELIDGEWHHSGLSSRGDPIYEIWTKRSKLGL